MIQGLAADLIKQVEEAKQHQRLLNELSYAGENEEDNSGDYLSITTHLVINHCALIY